MSDKQDSEAVMNTLLLEIDEVHCGGCVRRVTSILNSLPGIVVKDVRVGSVTLDVDPAKTTSDAGFAALRTGGYSAREEVGNVSR